jgi:putative FmdB family regulatory protein
VPPPFSESSIATTDKHMPFYEYQCSHCGHYFEALQKISESPLRKCPSCGKNALKKLLSAPVFRLKGSGWYETDFKSDQEQKRNLAGADKEASDSSAGTETKAKGESESTSKPETKAQGASDSTAAKPAQPAGGSDERPRAKPGANARPASRPSAGAAGSGARPRGSSRPAKRAVKPARGRDSGGRARSTRGRR